MLIESFRTALSKSITWHHFFRDLFLTVRYLSTVQFVFCLSLLLSKERKDFTVLAGHLLEHHKVESSEGACD